MPTIISNSAGVKRATPLRTNFISSLRIHRYTDNNPLRQGWPYNSRQRIPPQQTNRRQRLSTCQITATTCLASITSSAIIPTTLSNISGYVRGSIDPLVFGATASASFKLFLICAVVGWLLKKKRIPAETAPVLSQVSFQILIPCMLFSKVATMLATQPDTTLLTGMAVAAVVQITIGAILGALLSPLVDGRYSRRMTILGWHPLDPSRPAAAIASATAAATGLPQAAAALLPRPVPAPKGLRELMAVACTFGNSFTLPVVFFLSLLPGVLADRAIAYCGLFLLAWSPCLWSFGPAIIEGGFTKQDSLPQGQQQQLLEGINSVQLGDINGGTTNPLLETTTTTTTQENSSLKSSLTSSLTSFFKSLVGLTAVNRLLRNLRRTLNPPVVSILLGIIVGSTTLGKSLIATLGAKGAAAGVAVVVGASTAAVTTAPHLPLELSLAWGALRSAYEVIEMLAIGTLAMQTLVLASSLLQPQQASATVPGPPMQGGMLRAAWRFIAPSDATEARALAVLSAVRFVLLPVISLGVFHWVSSMGWLGPLAGDPIFLFVIAIQAVMPSAQNIIILLQLSDVTRPAAPVFAKMLLKLYAYSILPVTLWVTAFASRLAIPLV